MKKWISWKERTNPCWRRHERSLQHNNFLSSKTPSRLCKQRKIDTLQYTKKRRFGKTVYKTVLHRSRHRRCSLRKGVLRNLVKFTGKHLRQSLFFNKVAGPCSFIEQETLAQIFSCEFYEISKNIFFTEHLWTTASVLQSH